MLAPINIKNFWKELNSLCSLHYLTIQHQLFSLTTRNYILVSTFPWLHNYHVHFGQNIGPTMGPTVAQVRLLLSHKNGLVTTVPKLNP
jgi:hypothetical protein